MGIGLAYDSSLKETLAIRRKLRVENITATASGAHAMDPRSVAQVRAFKKDG